VTWQALPEPYVPGSGTRAVAATLAAHSRHLIWVMMADSDIGGG
jgi:hypothetical protein